MNENLKRHRPDIMVLGEGKALAIMQEDPMGEVDAYLYEKEEQHQHEVSLLLLRLIEKDKEIAALTAKYRGCKRELDLLKDTQAFYRGQ